MPNKEKIKVKNTKPSNETLVLRKTTIIQFDGNQPRIERKKNPK